MKNIDEFAEQDQWQESESEAAACRQMEADGCPKLPDLQPLRMADHINDEPEF